jgi:glyoxylase-like metal-dependent hydrolase (beta-lactamase superfamily II)
VLVIDPGWHAQVTWDALSAGLDTIGVQISDIVGVAVTHVHADHHGLSRRLREETGAWIAMHPAERAVLPVNAARLLGPTSDMEWLAAGGVPAGIAAELEFSPEALKPFMELAEPDVLLADGDSIPHGDHGLRAVWTPGHTPGHLCFYDEKSGVLLTGDHVLPRISPNIGMLLGEDDPLSSYLASLDRIAEYDSAEILPAHEYRFRGLAERTVSLRRHHDERCAEIIGVLREAGEPTAWQVTERLTWSRGWENVHGVMRRGALAETCAHLQYMRKNGSVELVDGEVRRWRASPHASDGIAG